MKTVYILYLIVGKINVEKKKLPIIKSEVSVWVFLTSGIAVKQKGMLKLEVQVFGDWFCQILHTKPVHDGETMPRRCQSKMQGGQNAGK